jgi:hypothetical protein
MALYNKYSVDKYSVDKYSVNRYSFSMVATLLSTLLFGLQAAAQVVTASRSSSFTYNAQGLLLT